MWMGRLVLFTLCTLEKTPEVYELGSYTASISAFKEQIPRAL